MSETTDILLRVQKGELSIEAAEQMLAAGRAEEFARNLRFAKFSVNIFDEREAFHVGVSDGPRSALLREVTELYEKDGKWYRDGETFGGSPFKAEAGEFSGGFSRNATLIRPSIFGPKYEQVVLYVSIKCSEESNRA